MLEELGYNGIFILTKHLVFDQQPFLQGEKGHFEPSLQRSFDRTPCLCWRGADFGYISSARGRISCQMDDTSGEKGSRLK